jgi:hypothetical protein
VNNRTDIRIPPVIDFALHAKSLFIYEAALNLVGAANIFQHNKPDNRSRQKLFQPWDCCLLNPPSGTNMSSFLQAHYKHTGIGY